MRSFRDADMSRRRYAKIGLAAAGLGFAMAHGGVATAADQPAQTLMDFYGAKRAPADWSKAALLLIDPQREYDTGKVPLVGIHAAVAECNKLRELAHAAGAPVFCVVHHGRKGGALFDPDGDGARVIPALEPRRGETVVVKNLPNAFAGTGLHGQLQALNRSQLVIAGFATHMCVSATARSALDNGYQSTVVAAACATRDLPDPLTGAAVPAAQTHRSALAGLHDRFALVVRDSSAWTS